MSKKRLTKIDNLKHQISDLREDISEIESQISSLEDELEALQEEEKAEEMSNPVIDWDEIIMEDFNTQLKYARLMGWQVDKFYLRYQSESLNIARVTLEKNGIKIVPLHEVSPLPYGRDDYFLQAVFIKEQKAG
jgi:predicted RNase H-like nuclease (RuvC/YqgF family)